MQPIEHRSLDSGQELRKFSARSEIFLATKVWTDHLAYPEVLRAAHGSLKRLGVDQIDLYLVHWPRARMPVAETMRAMDELVEAGQIGRAGVSNFSVEQFVQAQSASSVKLFTNQVPFAIGGSDREMLAIPKSASPERQRENLGVLDFELSAEEMVELGRT